MTYLSMTDLDPKGFPAKGDALTRVASLIGVDRKVWIDWKWWVFHLVISETDKSLRKRANKVWERASRTIDVRVRF